MRVAIVHDGERAGALDISPEAAAMLRGFLESVARLADAMESLAETEIALVAEELRPKEESQ